jgi:hypothetical protein
VQRKIQNEIDMVVGCNRLPMLNDRPKWVCDSDEMLVCVYTYFEFNVCKQSTMGKSGPSTYIFHLLNHTMNLKFFLWGLLQNLSNEFYFWLILVYITPVFSWKSNISQKWFITQKLGT